MPMVRVTRVKPDASIPPGVVKANFFISLVNVGQAEAREVTTAWAIIDNGHTITPPNEWLDYIGKPRWAPETLKRGQALTFQYGPDISAAGSGTVELTLAISYMDASTGLPVRTERRFFTDYVLPHEGDSKQYILSPGHFRSQTANALSP
jgi:hypothetical protein